MTDALKSLKNHCFKESNKENSFFDVFTYGLMSNLTEEKNISRYKDESVLEEEFYKYFCESKELLRLDTSLYRESLRLYERRDKFRYLFKKGTSGDNKMVRDLSASVIEKFNGYEIKKR